MSKFPFFLYCTISPDFAVRWELKCEHSPNEQNVPHSRSIMFPQRRLYVKGTDIL